MNKFNSWKDAERRLKTLYFYDSLKNNLLFEKHAKQCEKYFEVLKLYKKDMDTSTIKSLSNISSESIRFWTKKGRKPYLLHYAESIPDEDLPRNYKLLPLKNNCWRKSDFIKVPIFITSYSDILHVLKQLNRRVKVNLSKKVDAFFYLLGMTISDGCKRSLTNGSTNFSLVLSKKYKWSKLLGSAVCRYLNILGIKVYTGKDIPIKDRNPNGSFLWYAENSPLFTWITRSCLGLEYNQTTKNTPIQLKWILRCPRKYKLALIQGIADGDGSSSLSDWRIQIRTKFNTEIIKKILLSLDITSRITKGKVVISRYDDVIKGTELPCFRFAKSRIENAQKIKSMIVKRNKDRMIPDYNLIKFIFDLRKREYKFSQINSRIYDKFGIAFNPIHLRDILSKDVKSYDINDEIVMRYLQVLNNSIKNENVPNHTSYNTAYDWIHRKRIPIDVKRKLSLGYKPDKTVSDKFSHLKKFIAH